MKKYVMYVISGLIGFGMLINGVSADSCDYEKQIAVSSDANNVKAEYEAFENANIITPADDDRLEENAIINIWHTNVNIYNLVDTLYAKVTYNDRSVTYKYSDSKDGNISIDMGKASSVKKVLVEIFSNDKSCGTDPLKSVNLVLPRYNSYSKYPQCEENPDYYYCGTFITLNDISEKEFIDGVSNYSANKKQEQEEQEKKENSIVYKTTTFVKNYWIPIVITIVVVGGVVAFVIIRKRKRRLV